MNHPPISVNKPWLPGGVDVPIRAYPSWSVSTIRSSRSPSMVMMRRRSTLLVDRRHSSSSDQEYVRTCGRDTGLEGIARRDLHVCRQGRDQFVNSLIRITATNPITTPQIESSTILVAARSRATTVPSRAKEGAMRNGIENSRLSGRTSP